MSQNVDENEEYELIEIDRKPKSSFSGNNIEQLVIDNEKENHSLVPNNKKFATNKEQNCTISNSNAIESNLNKDNSGSLR